MPGPMACAWWGRTSRASSICTTICWPTLQNAPYLYKTPITFICQGAYAITDLAAREVSARRGFGKFLHTGNEADISVVDFLEYCEHDAETQAICCTSRGCVMGGAFWMLHGVLPRTNL